MDPVWTLIISFVVGIIAVILIAAYFIFRNDIKKRKTERNNTKMNGKKEDITPIEKNKKKKLIILVIVLSVTIGVIISCYFIVLSSARAECSAKAQQEADKQSSPARLKLSGESKNDIYEREFSYCMRGKGLNP